MMQKTIDDLGFSYIRNTIKEYCSTESAKEYIDKAGFLLDEPSVNLAHDYLADFFQYFAMKGRPQSFYFPDIRTSLQKMRAIGYSLSGEQLFDILQFLKSTEQLYYFFQSDDLEVPLIDKLISGFTVCHQLIYDLDFVLEEPGTVKATHPAIRALTRELDLTRKRRSALVQSYIKDSRELLQNDSAVYREDRVILPVVAGNKSKFQGVLHGSSGTGSTLFIEPYDLVERNNDVIIAEQRIHIEIMKILKNLSEKVYEQRLQLEELVHEVGVFDAYLAKAKYSYSYHGVRPEIIAEGCILRKARHPLLKQSAIPIDLELPQGIKALIMSGPNAGGKTVSVKTVGLFVLMNQFGLFLPVGDGSALQLFDGVFTDIGDEQSIEDSLSTFSGHMKNISTILDRATAKSLVIFDELGSGTDPLEGSALARAILEYCIDHFAITLITSHHGVLKQYAYAHKQVINASMEFNSQLNQPTFKIISGVPGNSYAIETAKKMRMPESVISHAIEYMGSESVQISTIIKGLEDKAREMEILEKTIQKREKELKEAVKKQSLKELSLRQREHFLKKKEFSDMSYFVKETKKNLEKLLASINKEQLEDDNKKNEIKQFLEGIEQYKQEQGNTLEQEETFLSIKPDIEFKPAMQVLAGPAKKEGRILRKVRKGFWLVEIDSMRITLPESELLPMLTGSEKKKKKSTKSIVTYSLQSQTDMPKFSLDLRGLSLQEALLALEIQIDNALVHGMQEFSIIHGKGNGILQKGVQDHLRKSKGVTHFEYARPEDGGFGKTLVFLKE